MKRSYRDFSVLIGANSMVLPHYKALAARLGFASLEGIEDDQLLLDHLKKKRPHLVLVDRKLKVFTGLQLLEKARSEKATADIPFLVFGLKDDLAPGGLAESVHRNKGAKLVPYPIEPDDFEKLADELLDGLIDPDREAAYGFFDEAAELSRAGEFDGALEKYAEGMKLYDRHLESWLDYAGILANQGQYDESENAYLKALEIDNFSLKAFFGMADLYELLDDYEQAINILRQALGIAQIIQSSGKAKSRISFYIGEFELRLKRLSEAAQSFDKAIEYNPDDAELRRDIGDAYASKGYYEESEQFYQAALDMDPNLAHVLNMLGITYRRQKKYEKALELYGNARKHHPQDENLLFNIARTMYEAGRPLEAVETLEKALEISPNFRTARLLLNKVQKSRTVVELDPD